ncbi:MAG: hypothetical protein IRY94_03575 [Rhodospirillaceae bacterium]|nr:hypothetical protein [Rhodospirillaceae bacterium]
MEIDCYNAELGSPEHALVLASRLMQSPRQGTRAATAALIDWLQREAAALPSAVSRPTAALTRRRGVCVDRLPVGSGAAALRQPLPARRVDCRIRHLSSQYTYRWWSRCLDALDPPVVMIDGTRSGERVVFVASSSTSNAARRA